MKPIYADLYYQYISTHKGGIPKMNKAKIPLLVSNNITRNLTMPIRGTGATAFFHIFAESETSDIVI